MPTLQEKLDAEWDVADKPYFPQYRPYEGIHSIDEVATLCLGDLCDYTERLTRHCKSMRTTWEDGAYAVEDHVFREDMDSHHAHLVAVAALLAERCRGES